MSLSTSVGARSAGPDTCADLENDSPGSLVSSLQARISLLNRPNRESFRQSINISNHRRKRLHALVTAGDGVIVLVAVVAGISLRFDSPVATIPRAVLFAAVVLAIVWPVALSGSRAKGVLGIGLEEYRRVAGSSALVIAACALVSYGIKLDLSRWFLSLAFGFGLFLLLLWRWSIRQVEARLRARFPDRCVSPALVVGDNGGIAGVLQRNAAFIRAGFVPVAVATVNDTVFTANLPQVGWRQISNALDSCEFESIVVGQGVPAEMLQELAWALSGRPGRLIMSLAVPDVWATARLGAINNSGLLELQPQQFDFLRRAAKRGFDCLFSIFALLVFSPVLAVAAILVYLEDRGPIIFRQQRIGRDGKPFTIHKIRTMTVDAEDRLDSLRSADTMNGALYKNAKDPRATKIGKFLRKTSIDELPQFWTVLKGDMSVVGPRPHLEHELELYPQLGLRRLVVKPGITGPWQIGGRSDLAFKEAVRLDLYYAENHSLLGDILIIAKTPFTLMRKKGAY